MKPSTEQRALEKRTRVGVLDEERFEVAPKAGTAGFLLEQRHPLRWRGRGGRGEHSLETLVLLWRHAAPFAPPRL